MQRVVQGKEGEIAAEWVALSSLRPWAANPRKNDHVVAALADAIARFGWGAPILACRANREIIAGHTRYKAAVLLGLTDVPVRWLDLSPVEARMLALADNRTSEIAEWDDPKLNAVLMQLRAEDIDLKVGTGFGESEVLARIGAPNPDFPRADDDAAVDAALDGLLDPSQGEQQRGTEVPALVYRKWRLAMTAAQADRFDSLITEALDRHGSTFGLVTVLLDNLKRNVEADLG